MNWMDTYRSKVVTAEEAVSHIESGQRVFLTGNCSMPVKTLRHVAYNLDDKHLGRWSPAFTRRLSRMATGTVLGTLARVLGEFGGLVHFISLVGTTSDEFIIPAIADVVGFSFSGAKDPKTQLFNFLRDKHLLLVVDNLEHLLKGMDVLPELLACGSGIKILATSREQLNLQAEWVFGVEGFPIPHHLSLENIASNSAAVLFLQRARQLLSELAQMFSERTFRDRLACGLNDANPGFSYFAMFVLGYLGMPRRYHAYPPEFQVLNVMSSAGATILGVGYLIPLVYFIWSMRYGRHASSNPWGVVGLEWETTSPPPTFNFDRPVVVDEPAYDYRPHEEVTVG